MIRFGYVAVSLLVLCGSLGAQGPTLQDQLASESPASLVSAARRDGDARRGAIVYHQPSLACTKCHSVGQPSRSPLLGPDLARPEPNATAEAIIESLLEPSKVIRKGFEPIIVQLTDGTTVTGLLVEESDDRVVLRDVARLGEPLTIEKSRIDERLVSKTSIMPAGQVNVLASRQQFLDLAKYLIEIAEGGPERARQLQPPPSLFTFVLPEYEKQIDHAGMLRDLDDKAFQRGEAIYSRLCVNCHGTRDQPGSLPTSLKFAEGKFKNGHDPFRMYQTLTHGFGLMAPQTWMVPQQKYDVIHYVRETYLKPHNASQYAGIDSTYLASLPQGTTRGPAPSKFEPWSSMDYGPYLMATYETGSDGSNFAHKGIATRLDPGPGGVSRGKYWQVFDHDTLRVAAAWSRPSASPATAADESNFIDWRGINFDGRHQIHPRIAGLVHFTNPTGPGWAHPETGSFVDARVLGRDNKQYGPLPRDWAQYRGLYQFGDQVIVSYTVGSARVLEMPGVVEIAGMPLAVKSDHRADQAPENSVGTTPIFTRTFHIGPRSRPMLLKVATHPSGSSRLETIDLAGKPNAGMERGAVAVLSAPPANAVKAAPAVPSFDGGTRIDVQKSEDFDLTEKDYTIAARIKTKAGGTILCQAPVAGPWTPDGKTFFVRGGRLTFDIGWVGAVTGKSNVGDDRWHDVAMTWQHESGRVRLFVDGKLDGQGSLKPKARAAKQTIRLGFTSPNFPDPTYFKGRIADVRFIQRGLTDDEIRTVPQLMREELLAHWKLDARTADGVRDETGRGHDGRVMVGTAPVHDEANVRIAAGVSPMPAGAKWLAGDLGALVLSLPEGTEPLKCVLSVMSLPEQEIRPDLLTALLTQPALDLSSLTTGGPRRWHEELNTDVAVGPDHGPFAVDVLPIPGHNPWSAQMRLTGFDFFADGDRMAVCSWDGDVWIVSGLKGSGEANDKSSTLRWRRIANGLFQPLGLKIVDGQIFVTCRDQLAVLRDLNNDGETDFVECFNNDHQVTEHFHEFAMGLQTDSDGNFYYAKSGRHALESVVPHHGTLLKVSKDGSRTEILATGFRAANGVCLNPDGSFVVTDQEGFWNPKNRINWVTPAGPGERPRFYGNMFGYHDVDDASDSAMEPPLCWITNSFDRSPAELLWVTSDTWGPLKGSLLNLSYGYGKVFVVPFEKLATSAPRNTATVQGGMCELPLPTFPTGIMRGRFHPVDGHLYTCGMFAWAGNATQPGGLYRIRATGRPVHLPIGLTAHKDGMQIRFSGDLRPVEAVDSKRYTVRTWSLNRTAGYGSKHYDEKTLPVTSVKLSDDHRTVMLELPDIQPTWCMSIEYKLVGSAGEPIQGMIHNTIHSLRD
jgi:putative heme-binding domain-containing protein